MDVMNLKSLMKSEGFNEYQVEEIAHSGDIKAHELLAKSIGRWKHWNGTDDYLKPKMFDRWRKWIKMRKIVKHWLDFLTNRQQHKQADVSHAFLKWKHFFADKQNNLQRHTYAQLKKRAVLAAKRLEQLADATQQDEDLIEHISDQNAELTDNYRKSQRLAMALWRDNRTLGTMKGYSRMMDNTKGDRGKQMEDQLATSIDTIAAAKDRMT